MTSLTSSTAQTDINNPSAEPSTDDFLAREKAVLGEDAEQFATSEDANAFGEPSGDLIGGDDNAQSTFESQFPDLASPSAVRRS
jgi:hypothetical protein